MSLSVETGQNLVRSGDIREGMSGIAVNKNQNVPQEGNGFLQQLKSAIQEVDKMQKTSNVASIDLASGHNKNIHEAMILMEKADIALRTLTAVRNKVIESYREVMRMQV